MSSTESNVPTSSSAFSVDGNNQRTFTVNNSSVRDPRLKPRSQDATSTSPGNSAVSQTKSTGNALDPPRYPAVSYWYNQEGRAALGKDKVAVHHRSPLIKDPPPLMLFPPLPVPHPSQTFPRIHPPSQAAVEVRPPLPVPHPFQNVPGMRPPFQAAVEVRPPLPVPHPSQNVPGMRPPSQAAVEVRPPLPVPHPSQNVSRIRPPSQTAVEVRPPLPVPHPSQNAPRMRPPSQAAVEVRPPLPVPHPSQNAFRIRPLSQAVSEVRRPLSVPHPSHHDPRIRPSSQAALEVPPSPSYSESAVTQSGPLFQRRPASQGALEVSPSPSSESAVSQSGPLFQRRTDPRTALEVPPTPSYSESVVTQSGPLFHRRSASQATSDVPPSPSYSESAVTQPGLQFHRTRPASQATSDVPPSPSYSESTVTQSGSQFRRTRPASQATVDVPPSPSYSESAVTQSSHQFHRTRPVSQATLDVPPSPSYSESAVTQSGSQFHRRRPASQATLDVPPSPSYSESAVTQSSSQFHRTRPALKITSQFPHIPSYSRETTVHDQSEPDFPKIQPASQTALQITNGSSHSEDAVPESSLSFQRTRPTSQTTLEITRTPSYVEEAGAQPPQNFQRKPSHLTFHIARGATEEGEQSNRPLHRVPPTSQTTQQAISNTSSSEATVSTQAGQKRFITSSFPYKHLQESEETFSARVSSHNTANVQRHMHPSQSDGVSASIMENFETYEETSETGRTNMLFPDPSDSLDDGSLSMVEHHVNVTSFVSSYCSSGMFPQRNFNKPGLLGHAPPSLLNYNYGQMQSFRARSYAPNRHMFPRRDNRYRNWNYGRGNFRRMGNPNTFNEEDAYRDVELGTGNHFEYYDETTDYPFDEPYDDTPSRLPTSKPVPRVQSSEEPPSTTASVSSSCSRPASSDSPYSSTQPQQQKSKSEETLKLKQDTTPSSKVASKGEEISKSKQDTPSSSKVVPKNEEISKSKQDTPSSSKVVPKNEETSKSKQDTSSSSKVVPKNEETSKSKEEKTSSKKSKVSGIKDKEKLLQHMLESLFKKSIQSMREDESSSSSESEQDLLEELRRTVKPSKFEKIRRIIESVDQEDNDSDREDKVKDKSKKMKHHKSSSKGVKSSDGVPSKSSGKEASKEEIDEVQETEKFEDKSESEDKAEDDDSSKVKRTVEGSVAKKDISQKDKGKSKKVDLKEEGIRKYESEKGNEPRTEQDAKPKSSTTSSKQVAGSKKDHKRDVKHKKVKGDESVKSSQSEDKNVKLQGTSTTKSKQPTERRLSVEYLGEDANSPCSDNEVHVTKKELGKPQKLKYISKKNESPEIRIENTVDESVKSIQSENKNLKIQGTSTTKNKQPTERRLSVEYLGEGANSPCSDNDVHVMKKGLGKPQKLKSISKKNESQDIRIENTLLSDEKQIENVLLEKEPRKSIVSLRDNKAKLGRALVRAKLNKRRQESCYIRRRRRKRKQNSNSDENQPKAVDLDSEKLVQNDEPINEVEEQDISRRDDELQEKAKKVVRKRVVKKHKTALERLQEDLNDSFIGKEVLKATGFRMCRMKTLEQNTCVATNVKQDEKPLINSEQDQNDNEKPVKEEEDQKPNEEENHESKDNQQSMKNKLFQFTKQRKLNYLKRGKMFQRRNSTTAGTSVSQKRLKEAKKTSIRRAAEKRKAETLKMADKDDGLINEEDTGTESRVVAVTDTNKKPVKKVTGVKLKRIKKKKSHTEVDVLKQDIKESFMGIGVLKRFGRRKRKPEKQEDTLQESSKSRPTTKKTNAVEMEKLNKALEEFINETMSDCSDDKKVELSQMDSKKTLSAAKVKKKKDKLLKFESIKLKKRRKIQNSKPLSEQASTSKSGGDTKMSKSDKNIPNNNEKGDTNEKETVSGELNVQSKQPKVKKKKRTFLEVLEDDLKDSFIGNEVLSDIYNSLSRRRKKPRTSVAPDEQSSKASSTMNTSLSSEKEEGSQPELPDYGNESVSVEEGSDSSWGKSKNNSSGEGPKRKQEGKRKVSLNRGKHCGKGTKGKINQSVSSEAGSGKNQGSEEGITDAELKSTEKEVSSKEDPDKNDKIDGSAKEENSQGNLDSKTESDLHAKSENITPKKPRKCRSQLEKLQDDLGESLFGEQVIKATGYRMCRMKNEQPQTNAGQLKQGSIIKKTMNDIRKGIGLNSKQVKSKNVAEVQGGGQVEKPDDSREKDKRKDDFKDVSTVENNDQGANVIDGENKNECPSNSAGGKQVKRQSLELERLQKDLEESFLGKEVLSVVGSRKRKAKRTENVEEPKKISISMEITEDNTAEASRSRNGSSGNSTVDNSGVSELNTNKEATLINEVSESTQNAASKGKTISKDSEAEKSEQTAKRARKPRWLKSLERDIKHSFISKDIRAIAKQNVSRMSRKLQGVSLLQRKQRGPKFAMKPKLESSKDEMCNLGDQDNNAERCGSSADVTDLNKKIESVTNVPNESGSCSNVVLNNLSGNQQSRLADVTTSSNKSESEMYQQRINNRYKDLLKCGATGIAKSDETLAMTQEVQTDRGECSCKDKKSSFDDVFPTTTDFRKYDRSIKLEPKLTDSSPKSEDEKIVHSIKTDPETSSEDKYTEHTKLQNKRGRKKLFQQGAKHADKVEPYGVVKEKLTKCTNCNHGACSYKLTCKIPVGGSANPGKLLQNMYLKSSILGMNPRLDALSWELRKKYGIKPNLFPTLPGLKKNRKISYSRMLKRRIPGSFVGGRKCLTFQSSSKTKETEQQQMEKYKMALEESSSTSENEVTDSKLSKDSKCDEIEVIELFDDDDDDDPVHVYSSVVKDNEKKSEVDDTPAKSRENVAEFLSESSNLAASVSSKVSCYRNNSKGSENVPMAVQKDLTSGDIQREEVIKTVSAPSDYASKIARRNSINDNKTELQKASESKTTCKADASIKQVSRTTTNDSKSLPWPTEEITNSSSSTSQPQIASSSSLGNLPKSTVQLKSKFKDKEERKKSETDTISKSSLATLKHSESLNEKVRKAPTDFSKVNFPRSVVHESHVFSDIVTRCEESKKSRTDALNTQSSSSVNTDTLSSDVSKKDLSFFKRGTITTSSNEKQVERIQSNLPTESSDKKREENNAACGSDVNTKSGQKNASDNSNGDTNIDTLSDAEMSESLSSDIGPSPIEEYVFSDLSEHALSEPSPSGVNVSQDTVSDSVKKTTSCNLTEEKDAVTQQSNAPCKPIRNFSHLQSKDVSEKGDIGENSVQNNTVSSKSSVNTNVEGTRNRMKEQTGVSSSLTVSGNYSVTPVKETAAKTCSTFKIDSPKGKSMVTVREATEPSANSYIVTIKEEEAIGEIGHHLEGSCACGCIAVEIVDMSGASNNLYQPESNNEPKELVSSDSGNSSEVIDFSELPLVSKCTGLVADTIYRLAEPLTVPILEKDEPPKQKSPLKIVAVNDEKKDLTDRERNEKEVTEVSVKTVVARPAASPNTPVEVRLGTISAKRFPNSVVFVCHKKKCVANEDCVFSTTSESLFITHIRGFHKREIVGRKCSNCNKFVRGVDTIMNHLKTCCGRQSKAGIVCETEYTLPPIPKSNVFREKSDAGSSLVKTVSVESSKMEERREDVGFSASVSQQRTSQIEVSRRKEAEATVVKNPEGSPESCVSIHDTSSLDLGDSKVRETSNVPACEDSAPKIVNIRSLHPEFTDVGNDEQDLSSSTGHVTSDTFPESEEHCGSTVPEELDVKPVILHNRTTSGDEAIEGKCDSTDVRGTFHCDSNTFTNQDFSASFCLGRVKQEPHFEMASDGPSHTVTSESPRSSCSSQLTTQEYMSSGALNEVARSQEREVTDLIGVALYRCVGSGCSYAGETLRDLKTHLMMCDIAVEEQSLKCVHCGKEFKFIETFLDHVPVHGVKRYECGLCGLRASIPGHIGRHMKQIHRVSSTSVSPVDPYQANPETSYFVVFPKDSFASSTNESSN